MSWNLMTDLQNVYSLEKDIVGKEVGGKTLLPIYHSTQKAQLEVTLLKTDAGVEFGYATVLDENDCVTIIPTTDDSATRSSGVAPHPLCDKLIYVAGDYYRFVKSAKKNAVEYYKSYIDQLGIWVDSDYSDDIVKAVYDYLSRGTLIADLISVGVLTLDASGSYINEKIKLNKIAQPECFVRFAVTDENSLETTRVWESEELFEKYIALSDSLADDIGLCYVTGEEVPLTYKHSAKVRNAGDKAKLLSSNDKTNFTFRGRFTTDREAYAVGRGVSQKAHLALRWLIERQGFGIGTAKFIIWESELRPLFDIQKHLDEQCTDAELIPEAQTNPEYGKVVSLLFKGYRQRFNPKSKVSLAVVDAATPGRLSLVQYHKFTTSDYYNNLEKWYSGSIWKGFYTDKNTKKRVYTDYFTPTPLEIATYAYGVEHSDKAYVEAEDKLMSIICRELYSCITEGLPVPKHILTALFNKCSFPLKYSEKYTNWDKLLSITCALFRKHYIETKGVVFNVAVDRNCKDRSYLYGRLVAIADKMELDTYSKGEVRVTNAKRYMNAMINAPFKTWTYLFERVNPYCEKLIKSNYGFFTLYERLQEEITALFAENPEGFSSNEKLDARFYLGYYSQKQEFYTKKDNNEEEE